MGNLYFFSSLINLISENNDAILAIPSEVKYIIVGGVVLMAISSIFRHAWKLLKFCGLSALIYYLMVYFQLI